MLDLEKYLAAQREEIEKFIWCLGTEIGHNPREDKTESELGCEWINNYAGDFAKYHRTEYEIA